MSESVAETAARGVNDGELDWTTYRTSTFDELIRAYDEAMEARNQKAVRGRGESW